MIRPFFRKKLPPLYKTGPAGKEWKHRYGGEAKLMVKGTSRRVIVVRSPDPKVFEEAIFVLKEDFMRQRSAEQVVEEARRAAGDFLRNNTTVVPRRRGGHLRGVLMAAAGAAVTGLAWLAVHFSWLGT